MLSHSEDFPDFHFLLRNSIMFFVFDRSIGSIMPHDRERTPPRFNVAEYAPVTCVEDSFLEVLKASSFPRLLSWKYQCLVF